MTGMVSRIATASREMRAYPSQGITNFFDPDRTDFAYNKLYNTANGAATGAGTDLQAFVQFGAFPVVEGKGGFISVSAGPVNWLLNAARLNFHSGYPAVQANFISSVTTGITLSTDLRTVTWTAAAVPAGATYATINAKYGQGPSNAWASTNVIPDGALEALLPLIMIGYSDPASLSMFGAPNTSETITTPPDTPEGRFIVIRNGEEIYYRFRGLQGGDDVVYRMSTAASTYDYNADYQFTSRVLIGPDTPAPSTLSAFNASYSATGANDNTLQVESDNAPAYKQNNMFSGGKHSIISYLITASGHGKTNVDRGSLWSKQGSTWMLTRVVNANQLIMTIMPAGGETDWLFGGTVPTTGSFTHVSGATDTTDITGTAVAQTMLWPSNQKVKRALLCEGGRLIDQSGVFEAKLARQHVDYGIPNFYDMIQFVGNNLGSPDDLLYNDPSIPASEHVHLEYLTDAYGATTVRHEVITLIDHHRDFMWPWQFQKINARSGETLWLIVPNTVSFQSGIDNDAGTPIDFSAGADVTANTLEYYFSSAAWADSSIWADGVRRPSRLYIFEVRNADGVAIRRFVMGHDGDIGETAANDYSPITGFFSGADKMYGVTSYNLDKVAGEADVCIGYFGITDPAFDAEAACNFAWPKWGGSYGFRWHTLNTVSDYVIPVHPNLIGKRIRIVSRNTTVALSDDVVGAEGIAVTTTGAGGFEAVLS